MLGNLMDLFGKTGLNTTQLMNLISGKATKEDIKKMVTPLLVKYTPYVGQALNFKAKQLGATQVVFIISNGIDEAGNEVETVTIATVEVDGSFDYKYSFPLYQILEKIMQDLEAASNPTSATLISETKQLPENNSNQAA